MIDWQSVTARVRESVRFIGGAGKIHGTSPRRQKSASENRDARSNSPEKSARILRSAPRDLRANIGDVSRGTSDEFPKLRKLSLDVEFLLANVTRRKAAIDRLSAEAWRSASTLIAD
jgi:hypothetical protein